MPSPSRIAFGSCNSQDRQNNLWPVIQERNPAGFIWGGDAIYGGEMSAHHYFKEFAYCDSGMIPWLLVAELISKTDKSLSQLVTERMQAYPCSGEINYKVADVPAVLKRVMEHFDHLEPEMDNTDGVSLDFGEWRLNIRASNTEPLLRLNVESRGDKDLVWEKVKEIETLIN